MKHYLPLLMAMTSFCLVAPLVANDQFNQGMQQGNASKGQGASAIQGFSGVILTLAVLFCVHGLVPTSGRRLQTGRWFAPAYALHLLCIGFLVSVL
ncbi:hypothetical protein BVY36_21990 [Salmonella enterica subsp. enterica serovar Enteritidis]|nr:hypothetical protein [Salmonella enterica subsp. enterica serovar Enteritidis]